MPKIKRAAQISHIEKRIREVRGQRVLLDHDLAAAYGVQTKNLNKAVKRNLGRFPKDFMFRLTAKEYRALRFQIGTSNGRGGWRSLPSAFTEHGVVMLASVLNCRVAMTASVQIVRGFLRMREMLAGYRGLARKLAELEERYDEQFRVVFEAIREIIDPPEPPRRLIGFRGKSESPDRAPLDRGRARR